MLRGYYSGVNPSLPDESPGGESFDYRERVLKSRHSAKRPRTGGNAPTRNLQSSTFSTDMHNNRVETEQEKQKEEEEGKGSDNEARSASRERPGECRKSHQQEKPVFEEDPDEEEIYIAAKDEL